MDDTAPTSPVSDELSAEYKPSSSSDEQLAGDPRPAREPGLYLVGLGVSAGALEALESFFEHMPSDSGLAFVIVQHLSPGFKSQMNELLSRHTAMAIRLVDDGTVVQRNVIYLIPPKKEIVISGGRLLLTDPDPSAALSFPIDAFFRSLAEELGERAVGIILSGTGTDGSRGIRTIHEAGGWVLVQNDDTAKFDGMPRSAIATGVVDVELSPSAMAQALLDYVGHPVYGAKKRRSKERLLAETGIDAVYSLLRAECGIDFSHYLPKMVVRRLDRRMLRSRSAALDDYVAQLRSDRQELNSLYRDLLIGVTRFFRDPELFELLKQEVVSTVLAKVPVDDEIRIWVAGCATGEEAYSLAILFHESLVALKRPVNVRILATDVHRVSLQFASDGLYDEAALSEVSPERLERYFTKQSGKYQVSQDLRRMIVFAPHNVIKDAPFTKLDLISCRNLLIYLRAEAQKRALSLFHFALKTAGVLVLGPSETPGGIAGEFETLDGHWKVYRKRRDIRLPTSTRLSPSPSMHRMQADHAPRSVRPTCPDSLLVKMYEELLVTCMPPSLLVNTQRELLHSFAGAGRFLCVPDGRPPSDILDMVDSDLRSAISGALQRAMKDEVAIAYGGIVRLAGPDEEFLKVCVRPLAIRSTGERHFLISLEPEARSTQPVEQVSPLAPDATSHKRWGLLEEELRHTKEILQATVEEMATANEELQATNEELVASNEELHVTNEELHSVNAELYAVNAEHQRKIRELTELTDDMDNLLRSTDVGTIFLDRDLLIRKFTPQIAHAFQLLPQDVGRRIECFAHNILRENLLEDLRQVLETEEPIEHDVQDRLGEWFLLRILPYRTKDQVEGVVLTLIAITRLKKTEQELRRVSKVFMDGADPIIIQDLSGRIVDLNREAERAYGWTRAELLGKCISVLVPPELEDQIRALGDQCRADDSVRNVESVRRDRFGKDSPVLLTMSLLSDDSGGPTAMASISKDITKQKKAEEDACEAASRRDQFLAMLSHELRNPLGALLNATRLMDRAGGDSDACRNASLVIERQSKHMARLLDDLLDVARVTQGKIHTRNEVVDIRSITDQAVQVAGPLLEERQHALTVEVPELPIYVEGDSARLLQVQENLLANAAKYTAPGGEITVSTREENGEAVVCVRDNGVGIEPEMRERIFELFVQGPKSLERFDGGMGIGLTMVRQIVQLHGGRVSARSDGFGKGSEFEVRLPLTSKRPSEAQQKPTVQDTNLRVVIVEDNADSRSLLESLLKMDGFQVSAAADGAQGYEIIERERPDVALVDLGLPGIDGYEVARRVRRDLADRPIRLVALTGYGRAEDRAAVSAAGFDEHLVKPVDPTDLSRVLRAIDCAQPGRQANYCCDQSGHSSPCDVVLTRSVHQEKAASQTSSH